MKKAPHGVSSARRSSFARLPKAISSDPKRVSAVLSELAARQLALEGVIVDGAHDPAVHDGSLYDIESAARRATFSSAVSAAVSFVAVSLFNSCLFRVLSDGAERC